MRTRQRNSFFATLLIVGLVLPGLIGIFAVQAKAVETQIRDAQLALQSGATATSTSTLTSTPPLSSTLTGTPFTNPPSLLGGASVELHAFVEAPVKPVQKPYVNLIAFSSIVRTGSVQIRGFVNSDEFICTSSPCVIYLQSSARLVFRAYADTGESSDEIIATVSVNQVEEGYQVSIDTVNQYVVFDDACSRIWGVQDRENATWNDFVQFPYQLNTDKTLHTLAAKLIVNGIVNASDCPAGGISLGLDWPTGCGLQKATGAMIAWQNQYDDYIWMASRNRGIPPKIIKTMIEYESQYWPANSRFYLDEVGLGQINQLGIDVLLRQDPTYYQKVCSSVQTDCTRPYASLDPSIQRLVRGAVIASMDATCPTCQYGLDLDKAKQSLDLLAGLLKANCKQVDTILKQPYKPDEDVDAATATAVAATVAAGGSKPGPDYEDLWRFTLAAYHSGLNCFNQAVIAVKASGEDMDWDHLKHYLKCKGSRDYVNGFMDNLLTFDSYIYQPSEALTEYALPTIVPTRTAVPTPTVYISTARIVVKVYMDRNGNGQPDDNEWIDAMTVQVTIANNQQLTQRTTNGIAIFDMTGYPPGAGIDVSLPGLYRNQVFNLPEQGDVDVTFKFDQPILPTALP
jgi:hypothetical protein